MAKELVWKRLERHDSQLGRKGYKAGTQAASRSCATLSPEPPTRELSLGDLMT